MRYVIDIDGTICTQTASSYPDAEPYADRISKVNALYDQGCEIVYWTARGMSSGTDWSELTKRQLDQWGCKYHHLWMGKPSYDVWVDDKAQWLF
jgi:uncharacterized HAD superfamily protein